MVLFVFVLVAKYHLCVKNLNCNVVALLHNSASICFGIIFGMAFHTSTYSLTDSRFSMGYSTKNDLMVDIVYYDVKGHGVDHAYSNENHSHIQCFPIER